MSLLTICQNAANRMGLPAITVIATSTGVTERNLMALANQEGKELGRAYSWQALTKEKTFTTTAAAVQTGAIPDDFDWIIPDTVFNRTTRRRFTGPLNADEWQTDQAMLVGRVFDSFRIRGNDFLISPTPPAGETVAFEYLTRNWAKDADATAQASMSKDTDTAVLDEELVTLGVIWRFRQSKGLDYAEAFNSYQKQVAQAVMRDGAKPRLDMGAGPVARVPNPPVVPDTLIYP